MKQRHLGSHIVEKILQFNDWFIVIAAALFTLLRLPSLFEPYWYGDEGIYETIGKALVHGRILYQGIWDNKPPLLYVVYAIFNGDQFWVRLSSLLVGLAAVIVFYLLSRKLFERNISQYVSTLLFALGFGLPLLEGNIANAENFILLPILIAWYGIYTVFPHKKSKWWFGLFGLIMAMAILTKIVAVFDLAAMAVFMVFLVTRKKTTGFVSYIPEWIAMIVGFILPIVITSGYFLQHHALQSFFAATFSRNINYVGVNNFFLFPLGLVVLKVLGLLIGLVVLWRFRKRISAVQLLILSWFVWGTFSAFFSERPYTHYLLMLLPSFSLLIGLLWERKVRRGVIGILIVAVLILVELNFPVYSKVGSYYQNYVSYILGSETAQEYQAFFDVHTPRDYTLANFIRTHTNANENVYFWSDSGQLYALSDKLPPGKYVVAYHVTFYADGFRNTEAALLKTKPKYIVSTRDDLPGVFIRHYRLLFHYADAVVYERTD